MKNLILCLCFSLVSFSSFAADQVTCELKSLGNKKIEVSLPLTFETDGDALTEEGLDLGADNYSFSVGVIKSSSMVELAVTFYENNHVQDEVGSLSCEIDLKASKLVVCKEPIQGNDGKLIARFSCKTN